MPVEPPGRAVVLIAALLVGLIGGGGVAWWVVHGRTNNNGIAACAAVSQSMAERALGRALPAAVVVQPDGDRPGATECGFGPVIVFAFRQGAESYFNRVLADDRSHGVVPTVLTGPGYRIEISGQFIYAGMQSQTFTVIKHGQYVNVILTSAPEGAAARLAIATAKRLP